MHYVTKSERESMRIYTPRRAVYGWCPECGTLLVIHNDYEVWPLAICSCGWADGTTALVDHTRIESRR